MNKKQYGRTVFAGRVGVPMLCFINSFLFGGNLSVLLHGLGLSVVWLERGFYEFGYFLACWMLTVRVG